MAIEKHLIVYPRTDYRCGPYNYYVVTPEGDYMYFETKPKAKAFIEFYNEYKEKRNKNGKLKSMERV